jgi:hypothetical protein
MRSCDDVDETALSYAEIKALCAGNPLIKEKMELDNDIAKLRMLKSEHRNQHYRLEDSLSVFYPQQIANVKERIAGIEQDIAMYTAEAEKCTDIQTTASGSASVTTRFAGMTIDGVTHTEKEPAAKALLDACKGLTSKADKPIGEYMGFKLTLQLEDFGKTINLLMRGTMTYKIDLGTDALGNITRINHALSELPKRLEGAKSQFDNYLSQQAAAELELEKPFLQEAELAEKEARLTRLNNELHINDGADAEIISDMDSRDESADEPDNEYDDWDEPKTASQPYRNINQEATRTYNNVEPRTGTYGKSQPSSLLGRIRNYDSSKQQQRVHGKDKPKEHGI